ncbi:hypothetical protein [Magnetofaba australis]|uniref:N-acetyltransferase domain-containing protein n=1 Tax=Magnetofaba australis IT-1 TaxID=1434232 RepID=A0A1Y2K4A3_9PROT|nr:hypothetical protein [Magnetofaba australis]OSM04059.1 hypothetical protein MAIT1_03684 [Magnetofaba australis IT-1]
MQVEPIQQDDLERVCAYLSDRFATACTAADWLRGFQQPWQRSAPNHGYMLVDESGAIGGVIGAIHSQQRIGQTPRAVCNMTSWVVDPPYRQMGMKLFLRLIKQRESIITNYSASPTVEAILKAYGFTPYPQQVLAVPHAPRPYLPGGGVRAAESVEEFLPWLTPARQRIASDHQGCHGLRQLAIGGPATGFAHLLFFTARCRNLPCIDVIDVDKPELVKKYWPRIASRFLFSHRALVSRWPLQTLNGHTLPFGRLLRTGGTDYQLNRGDDLPRLSPLYSESVTLRGC